MMKQLSFVPLALLAFLPALGCNLSPSPEPPPPPYAPGSPPTDPAAEAVVVWQELLDGGYVTPDEAGPSSILAAYQSASKPLWLDCLMRGSSPEVCGVPKQSTP
jgi:hypothetical protein